MFLFPVLTFTPKPVAVYIDTISVAPVDKRNFSSHLHADCYFRGSWQTQKKPISLLSVRDSSSHLTNCLPLSVPSQFPLPRFLLSFFLSRRLKKSKQQQKVGQLGVKRIDKHVELRAVGAKRLWMRASLKATRLHESEVVLFKNKQLVSYFSSAPTLAFFF